MAKKKTVRTYQRRKTWTYSFETKSVAGKRKPCTKGGFASEEEAYKAGMAALAEFVNGSELAKNVNLSYGDFLINYLDKNYRHEVKETTYITNKKLATLHIIPYIGCINITDISHMVIKDYLYKKAAEGLSKSTVTSLKAIITKSLTAAVVEYGYIKSNPAREVSLPKLARQREARKRVALTKEQQKIILKACADNMNLYTAVLIGLHCGLRIGEIFALTWEDIDFEKKTLDVNKQFYRYKGRIYVDHPKCNSHRNITIDDMLLSHLKKLKAIRLQERLKVVGYPSTLLFEDDRHEGDLQAFDLIFRHASGKHYNRNLAALHFLQIKKSLGLTNIDFHTLRHTHCTDLIACGAPIKSVQQRMGHKNIEITLNIYTSVTDQMNDEMQDLLNGSLYAK